MNNNIEKIVEQPENNDDNHFNYNVTENDEAQKDHLLINKPPDDDNAKLFRRC